MLNVTTSDSLRVVQISLSRNNRYTTTEKKEL